MCYHYALTKKQDDIMKLVKAEWEIPFEPIYHTNGFNFPAMPVITQAEPQKVQAYHWGLIPHWINSTEDAQKIRAQTLNAKGETIFEKPSFRTYAAQNRCLILADGFFEWTEYKKKKYPHYIHLINNDLFAFAGLYAHWVDKQTGELHRTFTMTTTEANPLMARVHNVKKRMPVMLHQSQWSGWLIPSLNKEQILSFLQPYNEAEMTVHPVSKLITTRGADTNVPEIHKPFVYPELELSE